MKKKILCLFLALLVLLPGCSARPGEISVPDLTMVPVPTAEATAEPAFTDAPTPTEAAPEPTPDPEPVGSSYTFNPHLYVPILAEDVPRDYWDALYALCDALRAGEATFACANEAAYKWAISPVTLNALFPAACMQIGGEARDGFTPYEDGVGHIDYKMPVDAFVARQAAFETLITDDLNACLEDDDSDYEKCLKLYDFVETNYNYQHDFQETMKDGANYLAFTERSGQCIELGSVYAYYLLQVGVQAVLVDCTTPAMAHGWTYLVLDGKGYHSDPTWALHSEQATEDTFLYYFLMSGERRAYTGCDVDDLTSPLLPRYWASQSHVEFTAEDESLSFPDSSYLLSLDEKNKIVYYQDDEGKQIFRYGEK